MVMFDRSHPMLIPTVLKWNVYFTDRPMKLTVIVHEAIEGGYWAEVPAIPGCATEGDSWDELISNLHEAIEGCLSIDRSQLEIDSKSQILELAI
jgi:predicted RNase H-like HicB family nuclease